MKLGRFSRRTTRLAAAALVTAGVALGIGLKAAGAAEVLPAPSLTAVNPAADGKTAALSFVDRVDGETSYSLSAHATVNGEEVYISSSVAPQPGFGGVITRTVSALDPGTRYCFSVRAYRIVDGNVDTSPRSNEICATTPTPKVKPTDVLKDPAGSVLNALRPDLVAVRVSGNTSIFDGMTSVYEVVIRNDGAAAKGNVQLAIVFGGALQSWEIVDTPAGFNCTLGSTISCQGSLGGQDDPMLTRVANFQVRAWGKEKGLGSITASVDPQDTVTETNEANNTTSLSVNVK